MSNYTIELEYEQVDAILCKELKAAYDSLDPEKRPPYGILDLDPVKDVKKLHKLRKAFAKVLDYYGERV